MAIRVTLTNKSQQTNKLAKSNTTSSSDIQMSRFVYQQLRSHVKSKQILDNYNNGLLPQEFMSLLEDFNKLQSGEVVSPAMVLLDEYLGSLGDTTTYHFTKDIINVEPWVSTFSQEPTRNVVHEIDGVTYNVIANISGTDYNVVHAT